MSFQHWGGGGRGEKQVRWSRGKAGEVSDRKSAVCGGTAKSPGVGMAVVNRKGLKMVG
jgi:hypothetical protein